MRSEGPAADLLRRLQVPLARAAISDQEFFLRVTRRRGELAEAHGRIAQLETGLKIGTESLAIEERLFKEGAGSRGDYLNAQLGAWRTGARRAEAPLARPLELAELVERTIGRREAGKHPATRTFQALRIRVNGDVFAPFRSIVQVLDACQGEGLTVVGINTAVDIKGAN